MKGYKQAPIILQISAKPVTWGTFNLEYFFVYKFEFTFLRNSVFCVGSKTKKATKARSMLNTVYKVLKIGSLKGLNYVTAG